jgi:alpha-tubulin suppressor-like RCC1 family protein
MSRRYLGGWIQDGLFNPLAAPGAPTYTYELWSWGSNYVGGLGLGTSGAGTYKSSPNQVGALTTWSTISNGAWHGTSIKTDGTLWSWGGNAQGQLGLGNTTNYSSPKQVGALTNWLIISAGGYANLAVKTDGTLWSWGVNTNGQLGLGNTTNYSSPKQVGALTTWSKVSKGHQNHSAAVRTDGTIWTWGRNSYGQLGLGNTTYVSSPAQVGALTNWLNVSCGNYHTIATKTDGTLWSWGRCNVGQLGNGSSGPAAYRSSPNQVGGATTWLNVTAGYNHNLAVQTNGTLWVWGAGASGGLGTGVTTNELTPIQVGALTTWSKVSGGRNYSLSIKTDGILWSWGKNNFGQLGLGNTTDYSSPKQVGALTTWLSAAAGQYRTKTIALKY